MDSPGIQMHDLAAYGFKDVLHLKIIEYAVAGQDVFKQFPEAGDVPLPVAKVVYQDALGLMGVNVEGLIKGSIGPYNLQVRIEHDQRFPNRSQEVPKNVQKNFWHLLPRVIVSP
jgi:hypothetical protein